MSTRTNRVVNEASKDILLLINDFDSALCETVSVCVCESESESRCFEGMQWTWEEEGTDRREDWKDDWMSLIDYTPIDNQ